MQFSVRFERLPIQTMLEEAKIDIFHWKILKKNVNLYFASFGENATFFMFAWFVSYRLYI